MIRKDREYHIGGGEKKKECVREGGLVGKVQVSKSKVHGKIAYYMVPQFIIWTASPSPIWLHRGVGAGICSEFNAHKIYNHKRLCGFRN